MTDASFVYLDSLQRSTTSPRLLAAIDSVRRTLIEEGQPDPPELWIMRWTHPRRGEIAEVVCSWHERQVMHALHTLGVGGIRERVEAGRCVRCEAEQAGIEPRVYMRLVGR